MPLPPDLPIVDHHCHLSLRGEGIAAAERFRAAGGTHLFLATQNYESAPPMSLDAYDRQFATTCRIAKKLHDEVGVRAYPVLAPYPIDLVEACARLGAAAALELHCSALDLAGRYVRERKAVALGEVGRPHFDVPDEVGRAVEAAFCHALEVARESDCPAVVHSPDLTAEGFVELATRAREAGMRSDRIVKHYARARAPRGAEPGAVPSYLAKRELVREVCRDPGPWFLETDYLDDPQRPGAVLDLATVPRRASAIANDPERGAELLWTPFVESVEKVYGWRPELPAGGPT